MLIQQIIEFELRGPGPNHLQNLTPKCNILNVFWTYIVSKKRLKQLNFQWAFKC